VNSTRATVAAGTVHREAAVRVREEARVLGARMPLLDIRLIHLPLII